MATFYGTVKGNAMTEATRQGNNKSGLTTQAASWSGAIEVHVYRDSFGADCYQINKIPWKGAGKFRTIASGKFD